MDAVAGTAGLKVMRKVKITPGKALHVPRLSLHPRRCPEWSILPRCCPEPLPSAKLENDSIA